MNKPVMTTNAPAAIGPYSQAVDCGNIVFTSGQLGLDPATGNLVEGVEAQARQALNNLKTILEANGMTMDNVAKTLVFLADMGDFAKVNAIYAEFFNDACFPARSAVQVAALPKGGLVEIEAVCVK
ncbi:MAG: RidA family protein [Firmicutes bacterium]|nr:RidA family protein [Bacillota bacterium]